ncbi:catalase family peroxidase [Bordetella pseudohinzii]|uniref:Catalase-related peroxidase n=1 Tax=Bordetella pseudohinzii TaxID=1331258 RepID=A0A0J6C6M5_9BORD|nr:catalase family peroxidase [Bordetella pseudohinzii]ANY14579.1 catalase [Bordetella pseudohinzii]KMM26768.1 catalase [Bordetella pseudohinzii]KXA79903.1 catalase [Bordetella pseudohinzii]KXA81126.1 catalase [Bordetella pseudohinzii]CUI62455.1 hydroperoxidase II [Bordetella pseudohinzii]
MRIRKLKTVYLPLAAIAAIAAGLALAFAWTAGLIGHRATTRTFLGDTLQHFDPGYRRAHGKGMCFAGVFRSSGAAASLSKARVFSQKEVPAIGRFSIGAEDPHAADTSTATVSMALLLSADDKSQWRMKLNNAPYFATRNAEGFLAQRKAFQPDPATGQPDPARVAAFFEEYPEARKLTEYKATAPWPSSFAGAEYNAINAFILIAENGQRQPVRWSMRPHAKLPGLSAEERANASHDFLFDDIKRRLADGPLYWDLVLQLAQADDPVDDPSQPWPATRRQVVAGTLEVTKVRDQTEGGCRDINFDPTLVPSGIALSNDPVLAARAGIYSHSYNARLREIGFGKATEAIGNKDSE